MRADIAAALLHDPRIVFFDEPTIGLDVIAKEKIRDFINYINKEKGTTMLFTTHDMTDIEKTCKRMIIIDRGLIIYDGTVEKIKERYGRYRTLVVEFNSDFRNIDIHGTEITNEKDNKKWFRFKKDEVHVSELISEIAYHYSIKDLTIEEPDIEGIIKEIYRGGVKFDEGISGVCQKVISK
jgi:ABC-2 type transport system ATP-binding protein